MRKLLVSLLFCFLISLPAAAQSDKSKILAASKQIVRALKAKDMARFANFVHPDKGIRFSPYSYVDKTNRVFKKSQLGGLMKSRKRYIWGEEDGTGDPIKLTFAKYYERFIYRAEYVKIKSISYNKRRGYGNTIFNAKEFYPNSRFVEYYKPGSDKYSFMDWSALILVFQKKGGKWYLAGIVNDEWTI